VDSGTGNTIRGNSIHDNGFANQSGPAGIDFNSANNANDNQAAPVLTAMNVSGSGTIISGILHGAANTSFAIDFYANAALDPAGFLEGQTYLGSTTVMTDGTGAATFTATVAMPPGGQLLFSATATSLATGDTSEFSLITPTVTVTGGTFTYDGKPHAATASATGAGGVTVSGSFAFNYNGSPTVPTAAGTYTVVASFMSSNPAYANASGTGTLVINPAPLTVTANNATKVYGAPNPPFSVAYSGFVNNETPSVLGGALTFSTPATISSPVGSYAITPSGLTSTNYAITFVSGTLRVTLAPNSIYVLNSSASGALTMSSNASIRLPGTLIVDSSSTSAISASGNALVTASGGVLVAGGVQKSGNAQVTKTGTPGATGDPLANLAGPTPPNYSGPPISENINGSTVATINPGWYSQITVSGNARLTLTEGVYVIGTGGVNVSLNASLTGNGVTYIL
jgi:hypothetical protein